MTDWPIPRSVIILTPLTYGAAAAACGGLAGYGVGLLAGIMPDALAYAFGGIAGVMGATAVTWRWAQVAEAFAQAEQEGEREDVPELRNMPFEQRVTIPNYARIVERVTPTHARMHDFPATMQQLDALALALTRGDTSLAYRRWVGTGPDRWRFNAQFGAMLDALHNQGMIYLTGERRLSASWNAYGKRVFLAHARERGLLNPSPTAPPRVENSVFSRTHSSYTVLEAR